jgi:hypothetical protein
MRKDLIWLFAVITLAVPRLGSADSPWAIEWADHPKKAGEVIGDPVFIRKLYCPKPAVTFSGCELTVVVLGRPLVDGPLFADAVTFRTADGNLRISRRGNSVDIEADFGPRVHKLAVTLVRSRAGPMIVRRASGLVMSKPVGPDPITASQLVSYVSGASPAGTRSFVQVELPACKLSVVGALEPTK